MLIPSNVDELPPTKYLSVDGEKLAYLHSPGQSPGVVFLPGFMSNMRSTKQRAIFNFCQEHSLEFTTLDYYGHGESSCSVDERKGSIGRWMDDAIVVLDSISTSPKQIIVGSSMGAWIMILLAETRLERIEGLLGVSSAPDFTSLMADSIYSNDSLARQMQTEGYCDLPTDYDAKGYYTIHQDFLNEAETHTILSNARNRIDLGDVPLRLIHGKQDKDIDYKQSEALFSQIKSQDKGLILVEGGDHRLSKPEEIEVILKALKDLLRR